jgi:5-formyltetrahydrofolate cyclo-ligase
MIAAEKKALRQRMIAVRDAMDPAAHTAQSAAIHNELRTLIRERKVRVLHCFLPMGSEVDLYPLLDELLADGIIIHAPKTLKGRVLENYRYHGQEHLVPGVFGTRYPAGDEPYTGSYDMILVPGLAFTAKGDRLGYGAGYYDTFLKQHPSAYAVAVCFPLQVVAALPVEAHDHPVELVVTGED